MQDAFLEESELFGKANLTFIVAQTKYNMFAVPGL